MIASDAGPTPKGPVLVLVSFALVLLAAGLLIFGLAVDSGLTLIYASIACSLAAGILLILATRGQRGAPPPAPRPAAAPPVAAPAAVAPADEPDEAHIWAPPPAAGDAPAAIAPAPAVSAPGVAEEDYLFPISNYEQRPLSEVLPLLSHLYEGELDMVEARERRGANREAVLTRVAELRLRFRPPVGQTGVAPSADGPETEPS